MSGTQRKLTAELADLTGLSVMSFRHFDCLLFSGDEILKLYCPRSRRIMMGRPTDRRVSGELIVVSRDDVKLLQSRSGRFELSNPIFAAPDANFSGLTLHSALSDGVVDGEFFDRIRRLFDALPNHRGGWQDRFGDDFFELSGFERMKAVIVSLRETVKFHDPTRDDVHFKVALIKPPGIHH